MKYLLLLVLLVSCGKHEMPTAKDLKDNDGDGQWNAYESSEFEKNVADLSKFGRVKIVLKSAIGETGVEKNEIELENNLDISSYTKKLMVKNLKQNEVEDYFSEFTVLRVVNKKIVDLGSSKSVSMRVDVVTNETATQLSLRQNNQITPLSSLNGSIEINLNRETLDAILSGQAQLIVTNEKTNFIKERTYRVFKDDGVTTKIYYVSKAYPFEKFLEQSEIKKVTPIDKVSLLSTTYQSDQKEWWVREINSQDKVLVKDSLKDLSEEFLKNFNQEKHSLTRVTGSSYQVFAGEKNVSSKMMLKFRIQKTNYKFKTETKKEEYKHGRQADSGDNWTCKNSYRSIVNEKTLTTNEQLLRESVQISIDAKWASEVTLVPGHDSKGPFWELVLPAGVAKYSVDLSPIKQAEVFQVGLYASDCKGEWAPKMKPNLVPLEGRLDVEVEAFVEKI